MVSNKLQGTRYKLQVSGILIGILCVLGVSAVRTDYLAEESSPTAAGTPSRDSRDSAAATPVVKLDPIQEGLSKTFSPQVKEANIRDVLWSLKKIGNLNIVTTKEVSGTVTLFLENVTIGDALEIILITNGLAREIKGNIINIMTETQYQALYGDPYNNKRVIQTFKLQYARPRKVSVFLEKIKTSGGSLVPDDGSGTLIVIDVPDKINLLAESIKRLDMPTETRTFELKYATVEDVEPSINKLLTPDYGEIKIDKRMKKLIVTDSPRNMGIIENMVREFDSKPRQVLIEAKMIQVILSEEHLMGIDWRQVFSGFSSLENVKFMGSFPMGTKDKTWLVPDKIIKGEETIVKDVVNRNILQAQFGTIGQTHYQAVLQALQGYGTNKVISAPRLIAFQEKECVFEVKTQEAYTQTTVTTSQATSTTSEQVLFKDVGVFLRVTPSINQDGFITMKVAPTVSQVTKIYETPQGNKIPIVEEATTTTTVIVKNGVCIVIGGLIKDDKFQQKQGVPVLSSIPLIGGLFGSTRDYTAKTETVVFLTPSIVTGEADSSVITKKGDLEEKELKDLKPIK